MSVASLRLSRPLYESLPWLYLLVGVAALLISYFAASASLSLGLGLSGLLVVLAGVVVLLRQTKPTFVTDVLTRRIEDDIDRRRVKEYGVGAQILLDLGVKDMVLLTDTPEKKIVALDGYGLGIAGTHPIRGQAKDRN